MLGKASELKVKQIFERVENNPEYVPYSDIPRYINYPLDKEINGFLESIGDAEIISIQYQMSVSENICETALIIYKESNQG